MGKVYQYYELLNLPVTNATVTFLSHLSLRVQRMLVLTSFPHQNPTQGVYPLVSCLSDTLSLPIQSLSLYAICLNRLTTLNTFNIHIGADYKLPRKKNDLTKKIDY